MIALDEDALICDFAETYHIYNIYEMPIVYVATLAIGLRDNSRIKMAISGLRVDEKTLLLAHIADNTAINTWFKTEDGQKGQNRPPSLVMALSGKTIEDNTKTFESGDDFIKEWERLNNE